MSSLPLYSELRILPGTDVRHSWGLLPEDRGTLAFIRDLDIALAAGAVKEGRVVSLGLALNVFRPPLFRRAELQHQVVEVTRNEAEDVINDFNPQASSQLDGLAHVRAREFGYYGGHRTLESAREALGMHHWAATGIASRGILVDSVRHLEAEGRSVDPFAGVGLTATDLSTALERQGTELRPGDALIIRTGWCEAFLAADGSEPKAWNGLAAGSDVAEFLWNHRVALVGCDNPAVENAPGDPSLGSLHRRLLPGLGMPLMELLALEDLATACAARDRWDFLFVAAPMNVPGAVSSPANAVALL